MATQVANLIHFATKDIMTDGDFIKVGVLALRRRPQAYPLTLLPHLLLYCLYIHVPSWPNAAPLLLLPSGPRARRQQHDRLLGGRETSDARIL